MKTAAKIISVVFHPLILPTYAFALIVWTNPFLFSNYDAIDLSKIFLTVLINTFLFPVIAILLCWRLGMVKSLEMKEPQERLVPYLVTGVFYIWAYVVFRKSGLPEILNITILGATITLFAIFIINIFKKVSIHAGAMGCLIVLTLFMCLLSTSNFNALLIGMVLLAGIVGSSRLLLDAHTTNEIFIGYFVGVMGQLVAINFY